MPTHVNRCVYSRVNDIESNMTSRLRDFVRMNPSFFLGSKVVEDTQDFFIVYKVLSAMGVTSRETAELVSYQLKEVVQVWNT